MRSTRYGYESMTDERIAIREVIKRVLLTVHSPAKTADAVLKPALARDLKACGFCADQEDTRATLDRRLPVWRSRNSDRSELRLQNGLDQIMTLRNNHQSWIAEKHCMTVRAVLYSSQRF